MPGASRSRRQAPFTLALLAAAWAEGWRAPSVGGLGGRRRETQTRSRLALSDRRTRVPCKPSPPLGCRRGHPRRLAELPALRARARPSRGRSPPLPGLRLELLGQLGAGGAGAPRPQRARPHGPKADRAAPGVLDLPGGFLEEGEPPLDGLRREFLEETGVAVEPVEWLGAFVDPYDAVFVLGLTWIVRGEGEPVAADDIEALAWFARDELPAEMAFPSQTAALRLWAGRGG